MRHAAAQDARGRAARRLRGRDKRERVLGAVGREPSTDGSGPGGQPAWQGSRWGQCSAAGWLGHAKAFQISSDQQGLLCRDCHHPDLAVEHVPPASSSR